MSRRSPQRIGLLVAATAAVLAGSLAGGAAASPVISDPIAELDAIDARAVAVTPQREPACRTVRYTPSSAAVAMTGEWCAPPAGGGDVVVLVHGGGGYEGDPADATAWRDEHIAAGRTTFVIEYTLLEVGAGSAAYPRPEQNVMAAVQYARMRTGGDVIVHGFSAGARLAAIVATAADDPAFAGPELHPGVSARVDGAILFYGYYDGLQFHGEQYYGGSAAPVEANAIAEASSEDPPMLIVHGTDDVMTAPAGAVEFAAALDAVGVAAELVLIDGANHVFDGYGAEALTDAGAALVPAIDRYVSGL